MQAMSEVFYGEAIGAGSGGKGGIFASMGCSLNVFVARTFLSATKGFGSADVSVFDLSGSCGQ